MCRRWKFTERPASAPVRTNSLISAIASSHSVLGRKPEQQECRQSQGTARTANRATSIWPRILGSRASISARIMPEVPAPSRPPKPRPVGFGPPIMVAIALDLYWPCVKLNAKESAAFVDRNRAGSWVSICILPLLVMLALHPKPPALAATRSEEHTSELQSLRHLVCRLL